MTPEWPEWIAVTADETVQARADPRSDAAGPGPVAQRRADDPPPAVRSARLLVLSDAELRRARSWLRALGARWFLWRDFDGRQRRARVVGGGASLAWRPAGDGWQADAEIEGWL